MQPHAGGDARASSYPHATQEGESPAEPDDRTIRTATGAKGGAFPALDRKPSPPVKT